MRKDDFKIRQVKKIAKLIYPKHNFREHILVTVKIARMLASRLNADLTTVTIASYLHDIGRVLFGYKFHGLTGSIIARIILLLLGFDRRKRNLISYCILAHDQNTGKKDTLEAEIVANADALSQIDNFLYLFSIYYSSHGRDTQQTKEWIKEKYNRGLKTKITIPIVREMAYKKLQVINQVLCWPDFGEK